MQTPLLSVIVPTYNRDHLLSKCFSGLVAKIPVEIILVDDYECKPKKIENILIPPNAKIVYSKNLLRQGPNGAQMTGIGLASGEYITTLNDDDSLIPGAIDYVWELLKFLEYPAHIQFNSIIPSHKITHAYLRDVTQQNMLFRYVNGMIRGNLFGFYSKELMKQMSLNVDCWGGESVYLAKLWEKSPPIIYDCPIRIYVIDHNSVSNNYFKRADRSILNEIEWLNLWSRSKYASFNYRVKKYLKIALYLRYMRGEDYNVLFKLRHRVDIFIVKLFFFSSKILRNSSLERFVKLQTSKE